MCNFLAYSLKKHVLANSSYEMITIITKYIDGRWLHYYSRNSINVISVLMFQQWVSGLHGNELKTMVFEATILHCKAMLGWQQYGVMRWILFWIMSMVQDRSLDLLTSSPTCNQCATDAIICTYWDTGSVLYIFHNNLNIMPPRISL